MRVDTINEPLHYMGEGIECIDYLRQVMTPEEFRGFCLGNVHKYLHRHKQKGTPVMDVQKAKKYLDWYEDAMEKDDE